MQKSDAQHGRQKGFENFLNQRCSTVCSILNLCQQAKPFIIDWSKAPFDDRTNQALSTSEMIVNGG
jgi:hypothetical protein